MIGISHPKGAAKEYSELAANPYEGCGFGCTYCYVGRMPFLPDEQRNRMEPAKARGIEYLKALAHDCYDLRKKGVGGQVFFTFMSDMYAPGTSDWYTRNCYNTVKFHGFGINVLTKGGMLSVRDIDLFDPASDCYGATITTLDKDRAAAWEPGAPSPASRVAALKEFHDAGIFTWVSIEPPVSAWSTMEIIGQTHDFVDLYKIGGQSGKTSDIDWRSYTDQVTALCQELGVKHYVKQALQPYLPAGYYNPLRIPMHK